jgi:hypothetical protein
MARIKIEDLPVAENLTPEQEELLEGAGLRSFRPTLEGLEGREMMDAGLGSGLPLPVAPPPAYGAPQLGQVRLLDGPAVGAAQAPTAELPQSMPQGQQQSPFVQSDINRLTEVSRTNLNSMINRGANVWGLTTNVKGSTSEVDGNRITITFHLEHATLAAGNQQCHVKFIFEGKNLGGVKEYNLVGAGLHDWKGAFGGGNNFEAEAKNLFQKNGGKIECQRFNEEAFVNKVIWALKMGHSHFSGAYLKHWERIDGGIRIYLYTDNNPLNPRAGTGRGELHLTFKFDDTQLGKGALQLSDIRQGYSYEKFVRWGNGGPFQLRVPVYAIRWQDTGAQWEHDMMRANEWRLS